MKKFHFSLQKVLDYRGRLVATAKESLVKARLERDRAEDELRLAEQARRHAVEARRRAQKKGLLNVSEVQAYMNYFTVLDNVSRDAIQEVVTKQLELDRRAVVYTERRRDEKALEQIKDTRRKSYDKYVRDEEQKIMDESFTSRYFRTMQNKEQP